MFFHISYIHNYNRTSPFTIIHNIPSPFMSTTINFHNINKSFLLKKDDKKMMEQENHESLAYGPPKQRGKDKHKKEEDGVEWGPNKEKQKRANDITNGENLELGTPSRKLI